MFGIFKKKKAPLKNIYKVTYIPCATIDEDKGEVVCLLSNMKETYVEAVDEADAQKVFADRNVTNIIFSPHIFIDRITEVVHRS